MRHIPDWVRTDWRAFSRVLQGSLGLLLEGPLDSVEDIDRCSIVFDHIHSPSDYDNHTKHTKTPNRVCAFSQPWWHSGLTVLRGTMFHWRRHWVCIGWVYDRERFLEARRTFRCEVATAKRDSWRRLCTESTHDRPLIFISSAIPASSP